MAKCYIKIKFPCGYELEADYNVFGFVFNPFKVKEQENKDLLETDLLPECPLHGKKCKGVKK